MQYAVSVAHAHEKTTEAGIENNRTAAESARWIIIYTVLFAAVFAVSFSPFLFGKKTFIWTIDGRQGNYQSLLYTGKLVREFIDNLKRGRFIIPQYDLSLGWGGSTLSTGIDPFSLLFAPFFPIERSEALYTGLIVLKIYLAGLTYLYMCRFFGKKTPESLAGCFIYLFSGYTLYAGLAFPDYINPLIQLPLLIVGVEKTLRHRPGFGFSFSVMYAAICGYYHLYILTFLLAIYCLVRLFIIYPKGNRLNSLPHILVNGLGRYVLGLGLAAVILVPSVMGFLTAGRNGFNNLNISNSLSVHWEYFLRRLFSLISPTARYEWDWGLDYPAYAAVFLLAATILYTSHDRKKRTVKWLLGIALAMLFCPWCGWLLNGFQYSCNRWSFGLALIAGYTVTEMLPDLLRLSRRKQYICLAAALLYALIGLLSPMLNNSVYILCGVLFLIITSVFMYLLSTHKHISDKGMRTAKNAFLALICVNICGNALFSNAKPFMGWAEYFSQYGDETRRIETAIEAEPFRSNYGYDVNDGRVDSTRLHYNDSQLYGLPGTVIYTPLINESIVDFWTETEGSGNVQFFKIYSTDQRTILNTLLSVNQQYETKLSKQYIPYGYRFLGDTHSGAMVYQNRYALPWGYTYDQSISREEAKGLNGVEKQELMLRAVILDDNTDSGHTPLQFESKAVPYRYKCIDCTWKEGVLSIPDSAGTIEISASLPAGKEYYIRLKGFRIGGYGDHYLTINTKASFDFNVECGNIQKYSRAMDKAYPWYYGRENYLFCLGCQDIDRDTVRITISEKGIFQLDDIEVFSLPLEHYPERVEKLRAEPLENIEVSTNRISGTVDLSKDKILCLTVPYDRGWTAYVDGNQAQTFKANYAFTGLKLSAGHHDIVFSYHMTGLREGLVMEGLSLIALLVLLVLKKRRNLN